MAKKFKWPVLAADRQKLLPKESLSSSKVAELSIGDLKVTVNGDKFWAVWITVLQRILQPTCEAVYGAHLQLPFESLGLDNLELAGRARKRNIAQNHLQVRGRRVDVKADRILGAATRTISVREVLMSCTVHSNCRAASTKYLLEGPELVEKRVGWDRFWAVKRMPSDAADDRPSALATVRDMRNRGVSVDSLALNVALSTGVAADKVDEVLDLLTEAEKLKPAVADVVSYNTLIKAFTQRANYDAACEVLERMKAHRIFPNAISFNTIMDAAVRAGRPEEAWTRQQEMREHGYKPDKFTCSILVKAFCKAGVSTKEETVGRAIALLDEANDCLDANLKATLYNNVLEAATKADMSASVLKVMQQMRARRVSAAPAHQKSIASALLDESGQ
ncbi:MEE40 [Symbiodinium pilosum]|uniref:MEE40 protein n=1 Tax=Symbiodinium pilosum TaxID=2952 RepID=A0A812S1Q4_SYMPI|nr:MEE40 [Symbiodinium pilosum]